MPSAPALAPASKAEDTSLHTFYVHKDGVSAMHLVGDTLHSGSYDRSVASIDLRAAAAAHTFNGSLSMVHCIYADQSTIHVGNDDGEVLVVDAKSGAAAATIKAHKRAVLCMCAEEGMLYTGSKDCLIRQWDMRTRKCLKKIKVHSAPVTCVEMVDGAMYSGSWDGSLYTFANGEGRRQTDPKTTSPLLALTPAAGLMYAAYRDGRARVWAPGVEKVITTFVAHDGGIPAILVDEQARMFLGSDDRTISVWDLKMQSSYVDAEKRVCAYTGHKDGVLCLAKGETLLYSGSYDHSIKVWDLKAVDRALVPGLEERALPLHKLATEGAGMKERAARADPDWWKAKRPAGGPYVQPKLGLRFNQNVISPTVQEVFPGSVAEVADLQVGDMIKKINDFEVDTVVLLHECVAYLRPLEAIEMHYDKRMNNGSTKPITAKFSIEDLDSDVKDSVPSIVTAKQLLAGIYDVFDPEKSTAAQAVEFLEVVSKHADFFRQLILKYSENNAASGISTRAFWLLLGKSKCVSPRFSLAELDRIFIVNRIRQLYPHPRVEDIKVRISSSP
jgi:WD40 repeat protein